MAWMHDQLEQKYWLKIPWFEGENIQIKYFPEKIKQNKYYTDQLVKTAAILELF